MMETFFNVSQQTRLFLLSCVMGVCLGVCFDILRAFRIIIRHHRFAVFAEDFLFTVFFMLTVFTFSTEAVRGELRFFIFTGAALAFVIYLLSVGTLVVAIVRVVVLMISGMFHVIFKVFLYPLIKFFVNIYQKMKRFFVNNCKSLSVFHKKIKKDLNPTNNMVYNISTYHQTVKIRGENRNGRKNKKPKRGAADNS